MAQNSLEQNYPPGPPTIICKNKELCHPKEKKKRTLRLVTPSSRTQPLADLQDYSLPSPLKTSN